MISSDGGVKSMTGKRCCMCVCVYMCVYIYIRVNVCTYIYRCNYIYTYIYVKSNHWKIKINRERVPIFCDDIRDIHTKRVLHFCKRVLYSRKEPCIPEKEPYIPAKESHMTKTHLHNPHTLINRGRGPIFSDNVHDIHTKPAPHCRNRALFSRKRAPRPSKRALYNSPICSDNQREHPHQQYIYIWIYIYIHTHTHTHILTHTYTRALSLTHLHDPCALIIRKSTPIIYTCLQKSSIDKHTRALTYSLTPTHALSLSHTPARSLRSHNQRAGLHIPRPYSPHASRPPLSTEGGTVNVPKKEICFWELFFENHIHHMCDALFFQLKGVQ